jgi:hypothetical protein
MNTPLTGYELLINRRDYFIKSPPVYIEFPNQLDVVAGVVGKLCPCGRIDIDVASTAPLLSVGPIALRVTPVCRSDTNPSTVF